jgi:hypothetical protein
MNRLLLFLFSLVHFLVFAFPSKAQNISKTPLVWKSNRIDLGTILEEQGLQKAEFEFTNAGDSLFFIREVVTECGCTSVDYTRDTLRKGESGRIQLSFDPSSAAGFFSKLVIVKGNSEAVQDSLFLEGTAIPYPSNLEKSYPVRLGKLGFRLKKVNMGDVFDNEPKVKFIEFFNFGEKLLEKKSFAFRAPPYLKMEQVQESVRPQERGLIKLTYDSKIKNDLGFFEDEVSLGWDSDFSKSITLEVLADLFEYFPPVSRAQLVDLPQLLIQPKEIDLRQISSKTVVRRSVTLSNPGRTVLEIRKVQGNCECLTLELSKNSLGPGESAELSLIFDPVGRKGIDQRNIYIFSNDPVNPVQLIVLKSRIED